MRKSWSKPSKPWVYVLIVAIFGVIFSIGGLYITHRGQTAPPAYSGPVESISTGLIGEYASLIIIAEDQGYFKANGLDITIKEYPSGPAALTDLLAGKVDTAMASDFAGVSNSFSGEDLKILATLSKSEAFYMVARKDHGIAKINDLKGKKIGMTRKTVGEFYLGQFMTFNELGLNNINVVNLTQSELVTAVTGGRIDAAVLFEPNAYQAAQKLGNNALSWSIQSGQNIYTLMYGTGKLVRDRPGAIERYVKSVVQAEQFVATHDTEARNIIATRFGYDSSYINYIWSKFRFAVTLDQELLINMDDEARWAIENNLTTARTVPNYFDHIYFKALESVRPESITIIR